MERTKGFEPSTLALARRCSTTEPRPHIRFFIGRHSAVLSARQLIIYQINSQNANVFLWIVTFFYFLRYFTCFLPHYNLAVTDIAYFVGQVFKGGKPFGLRCINYVDNRSCKGSTAGARLTPHAALPALLLLCRRYRQRGLRQRPRTL